MSIFEPKDQDAFMVISQYGNATFYFDKEQMFDNLTRTDKAYSLRMVDWKQL